MSSMVIVCIFFKYNELIYGIIGIDAFCHSTLENSNIHLVTLITCWETSQRTENFSFFSEFILCKNLFGSCLLFLLIYCQCFSNYLSKLCYHCRMINQSCEIRTLIISGIMLDITTKHNCPWYLNIQHSLLHSTN